MHLRIAIYLLSFGKVLSTYLKASTKSSRSFLKLSAHIQITNFTTQIQIYRNVLVYLEYEKIGLPFPSVRRLLSKAHTINDNCQHNFNSFENGARSVSATTNPSSAETKHHIHTSQIFGVLNFICSLTR